MLNDFIAKLPIDTILQTEILDNSVKLPVEVDSQSFYKDFETDIKETNLTAEKAIYAATLVISEKIKSVPELLTK